jgi:AcrR family transcriptional regulator
MPVARRKEALRPRKRPLQARSQRTVEAVLKAAAQVFSRRGYAGATTNHIAEQAGVSIGSLYEYFPSKDSLLVALLEPHMREGEAVLARAAAEVGSRPTSLDAAIRRLVQAMVELHTRDRNLHRVLFEEAPLPRHLRALLDDLEARMTDRIEAMIHVMPEVQVPNPALAAAIVVKTGEALTHNLVVHGDRGRDHPIEDYVDEIVRLLKSYLTAGAPPSRV